jgi:hypothetical protein
LITRLTPGVLLPPDHRHELKFLIPIILLDMTTITVIDHGMSLSVLYYTYVYCFVLQQSIHWYVLQVYVLFCTPTRPQYKLYNTGNFIFCF